MSPKLVENGQHSDHSNSTQNVPNGNEPKSGKFKAEYLMIKQQLIERGRVFMFNRNGKLEH